LDLGIGAQGAVTWVKNAWTYHTYDVAGQKTKPKTF